MFACSENPDSQNDTDQPSEECVEAERESIEDANVLAVVDGNHDFAFDLYAQLRSDAENVFLSPYSISTALGMLHLGAEADTETEMASVLGVFDPEADWHTGLGSLSQELRETFSLISQIDVTLCIWIPAIA